MQTPFSISWQFLKAQRRLPSPTPLVGAVDNPTSTVLADDRGHGGSLFGTGEEEQNKRRAIEQQGSQSMIGDLDEDRPDPEHLSPEQLRALRMLPPSASPPPSPMTLGDYAPTMVGN